ncbi:hypothetical protein ACPB8Q_06450 [Methanocaldococcus indicus]|uniref:hypothetical protein n=1 Tax=Methanocaldococcus indicus TaxID=213231 RepID=UPI003C6D9F4E
MYLFGSSIRYNYVENHKKLYQEQINCCIFNKKKDYTIYTTIKPRNIKSTDVYLRIIESISKIIKKTVVGDGFVTIKKILRRCNELGINYIGRIRKNIKIEVFGKDVKIEDMFKKDFNENKAKFCDFLYINYL